MSAALERVQTGRVRDHGASRSPVLTPIQPPGPDQEAQHASDSICAAFLKTVWSSPTGQTNALARASGTTRAGLVTQLQRTHGNACVQLAIAGSRRRPPPPRSTAVQRCGASPCNCSPAERLAHADEDAAALVQRIGVPDPTVALDPVAGAKAAHEPTHTVRQGSRGRRQAAAVQRAIGDGHDLNSPRFAGDPVLEACLDNEQLLKNGASGPAVQKVQEVLIELGHPLPKFGADGAFGAETKTAVQKFQLESGLPFTQADGIIGPVTMELLDARAPGVPGPGPGPGPSPGPGPGPTPLGAGGCDPGPCPAGLVQGPGRCCLRGNTPPPLIYDTCAVPITPLAPGKKTAAVQAEIDAGKAASPPELTTSTVTGVTAGTQEEAFVLDVLRQLATRARWCTEIDVAAAIGRVDQQGNIPSGQVTVRIDSRGNAAAELVNRGPLQENAVEDFFETTDPAFLAFIEQLKKLAVGRLMTTFKLSGVKEENGKSWKIGELNKVEQAFARLKPEDTVALAGVELIRTDKIADPNDSTKELSGLFFPDPRSATLRLADLAFAGDKISFVGDKAGTAPASFQTILHEVGHAVETKAKRDATAKLDEANQAVTTAVANLTNELSQLPTKTNGYSKQDRQAMVGYNNAFDAVTTALDRFGRSTAPATAAQHTAAQRAALQTAAQQAINNRDARRASLKKTAPNHPALTDFTQAETRQNEHFEAAKARVPVRAAFELAVVTPGSRSRRLQNFVTFVTGNRIDPLTDYARRNWPAHPEEFFAEAYGLWLNDPTYLQANAPQLFNWFEQGQHRA
jgi:peptidoglycan hydrolase-like protein with peptidoglycan-binding domain